MHLIFDRKIKEVELLEIEVKTSSLLKQLNTGFFQISLS